MAKRSRKKKAGGSGTSAKVPTTNATTQGLPTWLSRDWVWGLILVLAVIMTYSPVWWAGFIWDDNNHVTANPCIVGPLGLKEIWMTSAARFFPMTLTTFWLEHALWGVTPLPYHLVTVLLHAACTIVLWQVFRLLQIPGAWLGAALWALHPVQVESVAWVSEMKNTQSCLFYLLTILFFVQGLKTKDASNQSASRWNYALTLLCAALAMTSKSSTVILPVVLCLCAWWVEGRWRWRSLAMVIPIVLMTIIVSGLTVCAVKLEGTIDSLQWKRSWPERLVTAGNAVWFYLGKLLWPHPLITIYPRWQIDAGQWVSYLPLLAIIIVLFILWLKRKSWSRPWFFGFAYFLTALLPVLGLVSHNFLSYSFVADHFQYLADIGPLALAGAGLARSADFVIPGRRWLRSTLCAGLLLVLGVLSWHRTWVYESEETLWTDTLAKNPNCWVGYNNLGVALAQKGETDKAIEQFQKTLEINPDYAEAYSNLGLALVKMGHLDEAIQQYQRALEINPNYEGAYSNLGSALVQKGYLDEAIKRYKKALEINPYYVDAYFNLGSALVQKGHLDEAIAQFQKAVEINPTDAKVHNNLGGALFLKGRTDEAVVQFQEALRLKPDSVNAQNNLAKAQALIAQRATQK